MDTILDPNQLHAYTDVVGKKAVNLARLKEQGYNVPPFVVLPSSTVKTLDLENIDGVVEDITKRLPARTFAVRSAAMIEDDAQQSLAGQFMTHVDVEPSQLRTHILDVIEHARGYLKGDLAQFSIIIQEYVVADFSGVTFTRHPTGERHMLIEYHQGIGEEIVSGKVKPRSIELFWTEPLPHRVNRDALPLQKIYATFQAIEKTFEHPQDIEWCLRNGEWYILQARPITTISKEQYQGILYLDQTLPSKRPFLYEQTAISEIAPRPTPFTQSVLRRLYADKGPIQRVYKKYGVAFEAKNILYIVGNQLYINREEELHTLFPSYSFFHNALSSAPRRTTIKGFWHTWKNQLALGNIAVRDIQSLVESTQNELKKIPDQSNISEAWHTFDQCYEKIFEINLLAEASVRRLDTLLKPYGKTAVQILSTSLRETFFSSALEPPLEIWIGNGLEIGNTDAFIARTPTYTHDPAIDSWWNALPEWRKKVLHPFIERAVACDSLREQGRWLTVGYVNVFRRIIDESSYFSTIEELESGNILEDEVQKRRKQYSDFSHWSFPPRLSNLSERAHQEKPKGISSGIAEGTIVSREQLDDTKNTSCILYTEMLTPDLVQYFDRINGVISSQGGILSHLAILARERHVPVVVNVHLQKEGIHLGDQVRINGDTGDISIMT